MGRFAFYQTQEGTTRMDTAAPDRPRPPLALVVDDEDATVFALTKRLEKFGFAVDSVGTLADALTRLTEHSYGLVITDLRLTGMDSDEGIEILVYVRQHCPNTAAVLMTGHVADDTFEMAHAAGAACCLIKPVTRQRLKSTLESMGFV